MLILDLLTIDLFTISFVFAYVAFIDVFLVLVLFLNTYNNFNYSERLVQKVFISSASLRFVFIFTLVLNYYVQILHTKWQGLEIILSANSNKQVIDYIHTKTSANKL